MFPLGPDYDFYLTVGDEIIVTSKKPLIIAVIVVRKPSSNF